MQERVMRVLREKHNISTRQFARYSSVRRQRLMEIELCGLKPTEHVQFLVKDAFEKVIEHRRRELAALEEDYSRYQNNLLDYVNKEDLY
jgi:transcriptional regulator with XRE-family HTH domain